MKKETQEALNAQQHPEDGYRRSLVAQGGIMAMIANLFQPVFGSLGVGNKLLGYRIAVPIDTALPKLYYYKRRRLEARKSYIHKSKCLVVGKKFRDAENAHDRRIQLRLKQL